MEQGIPKASRVCTCCGGPAEVVVEYRLGGQMTVCWSCARLATSELEKDEGGSYVPACRVRP